MSEEFMKLVDHTNSWLDTQLAKDIWAKKYQSSEAESLSGWFGRVSGGNKHIELLMRDKKFLFAGRILSNRGLEDVKCTYSNCYVLEPPSDSIESIYDTAKELARTFSYGGGVGIDLGKLRPRNAKVNNSAKKTTGAVSFMPTFSEVTATIGQNNRRGALMISMPVDHPDIEEFIDIKTDLTKVTKANISVRLTSEFMEAVDKDEYFKCHFEVEDTGEVVEKVLKAKSVFMRLCRNNWDFAEPGALFWDNIEAWNILSHYINFKYSGVNPCAEEPLPSGGSCLLGSLNLSKFVVRPFTPEASFDFISFRTAIKHAVIGLNEVLDEGLPLHPLAIQRDTVRDWRQIGLGIMGLADCLIKLGVVYGSEESFEICGRIGEALKSQALYTSSELAKKYGTFPKYDKEATLKSPYIKDTKSYVIEQIEKYGLRNSQILTIAPTGTLSTMLGISGGVEPIFNLAYTRKTESLGDGDRYYTVFTPIVQEYLKFKGIEVKEDISVEELTKILPSYFITAMNLDPINRVKMQSVWQRYIDASISSTVNLPNEATVEDVYNIYMTAYKLKLKGITVYRDGCKRAGILTNTSPKKHEKDEVKELPRGKKKDIAEDTVYHKRPIHIGCGKLNLFIGYSPMENAIQDLYIKKSGNGGCEKNLETTVISMSLVLRYGGTLESIEKSFSGISTCSSFTNARCKGHPVSKGAYCGSAIMNTIKDFLKEMNGEEVKQPLVVVPMESTVHPTEKPKCPECGGEINMIEGCMTCPHCGYSKCS